MVKISLKLTNFSKTSQRDLKKVKVGPKQILKKRQYISQTKKRKLKKREKSNGKIWRDKKREVQDKSDTGDKNIAEGVV